MKRAQAATAKQGIPLRTIMMMIPVIAGLSNPTLITQTANALNTGLQTSATAFAPDIAGYATSAMHTATSHTGAFHSSAVFISGGPIYLPHS